MSTKEDIPVVEAEPVDNPEEEKEEAAEEREAESATSDESAESSVEDQENPDLVGQFAYSFGHGFVQAPIDGVREIVNTLSGTKVVPKVEVMKAPDKKEIATPEWQAQKIGAGCGLIASLVVISNIISKGRPI